MQPSKQANSFGETIYGAYGEKLLGSGSAYVQSNVSKHSDSITISYT